MTCQHMLAWPSIGGSPQTPKPPKRRLLRLYRICFGGAFILLHDVGPGVCHRWVWRFSCWSLAGQKFAGCIAIILLKRSPSQRYPLARPWHAEDACEMRRNARMLAEVSAMLRLFELMISFSVWRHSSEPQGLQLLQDWACLLGSDLRGLR